MRTVKAGSTSVILDDIFIQDSSSTTGGGLTNMAFNTSGLTCYYHRNTGSASVAVTLATMTVGTFAAGGLKKIDDTNMPGIYTFCPPDAAIASGAQSVTFFFQGVTNMCQTPVTVELIAVDFQDAIHGGMSALPNTAVTTNGSLITSGTGTAQLAVSSGHVSNVDTLTTYTGNTVQTGDSYARIGAAGVGLTAVALTGTQTFSNTGTWTGNIVGTVSTLTTYTGNTVQTGDSFARIGATGSSLTSLASAANLATTNTTVNTINANTTGLSGVTFPSQVASPTNITAGTITTVTNLTNAPTSGDFTATMKTSLGTAVGTAQTGDSFAIVNSGTFGNAQLVRSTTPANTLTVDSGHAIAFNNTSIATVTNLTNAPTSGDFTATMKTSIGTAVAASAVASVTGNVGGNVTGSVGSISGVTFPTGFSTLTVAAIQSGLATPTNITAGTITTVTNLTNAPTSGDFTTTMKTSLNQATPSVTVSDKTGFSLATTQTFNNTGTWTGNIVGTLSTLTTYTGNTVQTGDSFARIGATGSGLTSLAPSTTATTIETYGDSHWTTATGFATPTNITAGTITTVTNLTNAATSGDLTATMKTSVTTAVPTAAQSATAVLTTAMTESYSADGSAPTLAQAMFITMQRVIDFGISGTTVTIRKLDGSTTAYTLTLDSSTAPTSSTRAT